MASDNPHRARTLADMDDRTSSDFATARRFEHELTDRQREVLGLISRGHTNAEIAQQLGLPLTSVKWHVSELLAKLGFSSREDAGEFWRWRSSRTAQVRHRAASLLGLGIGVKKALVGAGSIGATVGAGAVAVVLFANSATEPAPIDEPGQPFYLEATLSSEYPPSKPLAVEDNPGRVARNVDAYVSPYGPPSAEDRVTGATTQTTNVRWWFEDAARWKWERDVAGTRRIQAADGEFMWTYPLGPESYQKTPLDNYTTRIRDGFAPQMEMVGPSRARDMDELLAALRERPEQFADVVGHETVLGRDTTVIRYGPRGMDPGDTAETTTYRGEARIWLDEERMMIMRAESDLGNGYKYRVEVTRLDWGRTPTPDELAFNPPAGTSEAPRITLGYPPEGVIVEQYP
jgi:DNA-binding CsgD family transcriptional regulator/outer membrane lipoprotein-sorting protein